MAPKSNTFHILKNKFPEGEYTLLSEVSDSTGGRSRSMDFMAFSMWPSRGLHIVGMELKSFRSDWLREIKNPKKQELHFKYFDYFYLVTDAENVAKEDEIPETWGWLHIKNGRVYTMKKAPKLTPEPLSKGFIFAAIRNASTKDGYVHTSSIESTIKERVVVAEERVRREYKHRDENYTHLKRIVNEFEKAAGVRIADTINFFERGDKAGKAVRMVMETGLDAYQKKIELIISNFSKVLEDAKISFAKIKELETGSTGEGREQIHSTEETDEN